MYRTSETGLFVHAQGGRDLREGQVAAGGGEGLGGAAQDEERGHGDGCGTGTAKTD